MEMDVKFEIGEKVSVYFFVSTKNIIIIFEKYGYIKKSVCF